MAAKLVLKEGSTGKFRFNLVAPNGQVIATSEAYETKASVVNGIESIKRNAPDPGRLSSGHGVLQVRPRVDRPDCRP